jgi:hypothetical protein
VMPSAAPQPPSACNMQCVANRTEDCGGNYMLSAYSFTCAPPPPPPPGPTPGPPKNYTTQDYYEGMFTRLLKKVPALDWYWIWTPEGWEWGHMNAQNPVFTDAVADLKMAMAAHDKVNPSLKM